MLKKVLHGIAALAAGGAALAVSHVSSIETALGLLGLSPDKIHSLVGAAGVAIAYFIPSPKQQEQAKS